MNSEHSGFRCPRELWVIVSETDIRCPRELWVMMSETDISQH